MSRYVCDTHALHWHLVASPKLSDNARRIFVAADQGQHQIIVPGITLIEFIYLVEKGRLEAVHVDQLFAQLHQVGGSYIVAPLDLSIAQALRNVPKTLIPEMPDRIIAATAIALGVPLITRDAMIQRSALIPTIW